MQAALFQARRAAQNSPCCLVNSLMHPNIASTGGTLIGCWLDWHPSDQDEQCSTTAEVEAQRASEQHQVITRALGRCYGQDIAFREHKGVSASKDSHPEIRHVPN